MSNLNAPKTKTDRPLLSRRQIEVFILIAKGHSSKVAADMLGINKRTVDFHLARIYDRLQVNNRVQAYHVLKRHGLLPPELT